MLKWTSNPSTKKNDAASEFPLPLVFCGFHPKPHPLDEDNCEQPTEQEEAPTSTARPTGAKTCTNQALLPTARFLLIESK